MELTVSNSNTAATLVTVFAELQGGAFVAKVMPETAVPYTPYFENELDQVIVYIAPDEEQLAAILGALNERRLAFGDLQNYGAAGGGTSTIPVQISRVRAGCGRRGRARAPAPAPGPGG